MLISYFKGALYSKEQIKLHIFFPGGYGVHYTVNMPSLFKAFSFEYMGVIML